MPVMGNARRTVRGASFRAAVRRAAGFTLIEAVVASAILLLTSAGVTGVLTTALRGHGVESAQARLEQRVQAEAARLGALPYVLPVSAPGAEGYDSGTARCLLQAVFPHGLAARNTATAFFTPVSPGTPATFTTLAEHDWGSLRFTAAFVTAESGVWAPADSGALAGWAVWLGHIPPAPAVLVTVRASSSGSPAHAAEATLVLDGLRPAFPEPSP